jgi:site-specific DNA-cytosine methylase
MTTHGFVKNKQRMGHWLGTGDMTAQDYGLLQGFPRYYLWPSCTTDWKRMIGNAVPPLFWTPVIEHLGEQVNQFKQGNCKISQVNSQTVD